MGMALVQPSNPSGGWWWHARAWRHQKLWQPTMAQLEHWWGQTAAPAQRLVIIGASAGWMMSDQWLTRYPQVETWDIDPWARVLFSWRHGRAMRQAQVRWTHHTGDAWARTDDWLHTRQDSVFWFDNVLGQLRFTLALAQARKRIADVKHMMEGTRWGSVHDRYSGPLRKAQLSGVTAWRSERGIDLDARPSQDWLHAWGAQAPWLDHLTEQVFEAGTPVLNLAWPIRPHFGHWLELGWQLP